MPYVQVGEIACVECLLSPLFILILVCAGKLQIAAKSMTKKTPNFTLKKALLKTFFHFEKIGTIKHFQAQYEP